jgi:ribosome-associated protein
LTNTLASQTSSKEQALRALEAALEKKALEPVLLDVSGQASYTDYILLVSGTSDRHVQTISDSIVEAFVKLRRRPIGVEGQREGQWALIDFGDVVVHVFYHPMRDFYDLEGLWCDAPRVALEVPAEARAGHMY